MLWRCTPRNFWRVEADVAEYVVAVKRTRRGTGATTDIVREIPGLRVKGGDAGRLIVEATGAAIADVKGRFSADLFVEPIVSHQTF